MGATVYAAQPPDGPPGLERAIAAQEAYTDRLLDMPGVVGTGVGLDENGLPVIRIYTEHARITGLPGKLDGVPAETVVTGRFTIREDPEPDPTARQDRPVPIGVSTGHPDITAGTIGARVTDGTNVYALSNNHVYANCNDATIGDSALQPGTYDGGTDPTDSIGTLADFEPIKFDGSPNTMDAAIAKSTISNLGYETLDDGYGAPSSDPVDASLNLGVQKYGRTTGWTHGKVSEINVTVTVCYQTRGPFMCAKSALFTGQIGITDGNFSAGGDSGSLIVTDDGNKNPVGLLFAGSTDRTIANPIGPVLSRFNVTIDDGTGDTPTDSPPTVSITNPADGATVSGMVTITADASDDNGVNQVEFFVDGYSIGVDSDSSVSWSATWNTSSYANGLHTISATATDTAGQTATDSVTITVGTSTEPTTVSVSSIDYATEGGRDGKKHLFITVSLKDNLENPVSNASVSIDVYRDEILYGSRTGTTGSTGTVTFSFNNAPSGAYTTMVTGVTALELTWDGITPKNSFDK